MQVKSVRGRRPNLEVCLYFKSLCVAVWEGEREREREKEREVRLPGEAELEERLLGDR